MNLVLGVSGATGAHAADLLLSKSPWPVWLVASEWGRKVYEQECGDFARLAARAERVFDDADLAAPIASGSTPSAGMVILPCSTNTLAKVAHGVADTLITRAAHCHLKERRPLVLAVRESPWALMDFNNAAAVTAAGGVVMPLSPPFYQTIGRDPRTVTMDDLMGLFVDRVLAVLGQSSPTRWESGR
jgi:4-hydroxy-3-polyprenylbenzoate decarboxylase